ncbi:hypothetical protein [Novosphingobium aquimarinum]|uniref:hypothetical protein n=1 Tax=Novosphingobium aquimarinum TaxID=2682494 RepID=UPI001E305A02|nr:hypothetical protein [Novosphingobium aquimarinum]
MTRLATKLAGAVACLALAACAGGQSGRQRLPRGPLRDATFGSPGAIVAAELAFNRLAREKGQWTAFRETADKDAVMFVPQPVDAREWLKGRENPPAPVSWQPYETWVSCDGTLGASKGAWQRPDGSVGYFTTVWRRQRSGEYRWVLDQGDDLAAPLPAPEMLAGQIAECPPGRGPADLRQRDSEQKNPQVAMDGTGRSDDGTLEYTWQTAPDLSRTVTVRMRKGGELREVMRSSVAAPAGS